MPSLWQTLFPESRTSSGFSKGEQVVENSPLHLALRANDDTGSSSETSEKSALLSLGPTLADELLS